MAEKPRLNSDSKFKKIDQALLLFAALVVRLAWIFRGAWDARDSHWYLRVARNIAFNHVFSASEPGSPLNPTALRPPLYPAVIAGLWFSEQAPVFAMLLLQAVLGAATVAIVYQIAREHFERRVALLASAGMALAPMTGRFTAVILSETLFTFLLLLGIFFWGRKRHALTGIALGFAALTRLTIMPFLVLLLLLSLLPAWRQYRKSYLEIALTVLVVIAPWTVRNAIVFHRFLPMDASVTGTNLLWGTVPTEFFGSKVWTGTEWASSPQSLPITRVDPSLSETEQSRERLSRALRRIEDDPLGWVKTRARQYPKFFIETGSYLFETGDVPIKSALQTSNVLVIIVRLMFVLGNVVVFVFAALGLFSERQRFVSISHITLFPLYLAAVHLPLWIEPRYALPMMPLVAILAAVWAVKLVERVQARLAS